MGVNFTRLLVSRDPGDRRHFRRQAEDMLRSPAGAEPPRTRRRQSWADPFEAEIQASRCCRTARPTTASSRPWSRAATSAGTSSTSSTDFADQGGRRRPARADRFQRDRQDQTRSALRHRARASAASTTRSCSATTRGALASRARSRWADLFDTAKIPGKRTFYKWSAPGVLEIALLADGVAPDKLYPLDLDRAFKKLDTIKKRNRLVGQRRAVAAAARLRRGAARAVLERPRLRAAEGRRRRRRVLGAEPDRRRLAGRAQGLAEQGSGDEVPGPGDQRARARPTSPSHRPMRRSTLKSEALLDKDRRAAAADAACRQPDQPRHATTGPSTATRSASAGTPGRRSSADLARRESGPARRRAALFWIAGQHERSGDIAATLPGGVGRPGRRIALPVRCSSPCRCCALLLRSVTEPAAGACRTTPTLLGDRHLRAGVLQHLPGRGRRHRGHRLLIGFPARLAAGDAAARAGQQLLFGDPPPVDVDQPAGAHLRLDGAAADAPASSTGL